MCKQLTVRASCASNLRSLTRRPERPPSVIPISRVLWLVAFVVVWTMAGYGGAAIGQVVGVDDPQDMADSSGDIKRIEAWVDEGNLHLTMTVYGIFAPSVDDTPAGMTNRYYYHWMLDMDNNPNTGWFNEEYEGTPTNLERPIGADVMVQFGWRNGATNGVYAYSLDPLTGDEVELFQDYEYTIDGDTIHAIIPLADLGLSLSDTIAVSAFQEGASNDWQCDWVESFVLPLTVVRAFNPTPAADSNDIPRDVILSWSPGRYAATHDVYLGMVFDDVNDASRTDPRDVLVSEGQTDATFDPEVLLDFDTTYYWRIDEVNAAPDNTIYKGDVWSFTTEPYAYPIENVVATCDVESMADQGPENVVNGSGLNAQDQHSTNTLDMWAVSRAGDEPVQIQFEFDRLYKLHEMYVWNHNFDFETMLGLGARDVTVEYSADGQVWSVLGDYELAQAPGTSTYVFNTTISFAGVAARYVRVTIQNNWGTSSQVGLSEVRFMHIPVHARQPQPADGAVDVALDATLRWRSGRDAATHEVYLGTDPNALLPIGTASWPSYAPDLLDLNKQYYWRVDEVNQAEATTVWPGDVWSFTTQESLVVDDFEAYTDDLNAGEAIWQSWIDGWEDPANGSQVGYTATPFAEQDIVHAGHQSMPLSYDNPTAASISEAQRTFTPAQDWTVSDIKTLSLWFYGDEGNAGQLYAKVNGVKIGAGGDPGDITQAEWQRMTFGLSDVGLNLGSTETLTIGVEGAGSGVVYIDDIELYADVF